MNRKNGQANACEEARRGDECLAEAEYLLKGGFYNAAVSRAYYAAFHWACALLVLKGLEPKTHRGVIQLLHLHYVETSLLSADLGAAIGQLETYRELSDYKADVTLDESRAAEILERSREFVAACRPVLDGVDGKTC